MRESELEKRMSVIKRTLIGRGVECYSIGHSIKGLIVGREFSYDMASERLNLYHSRNNLVSRIDMHPVEFVRLMRILANK